MKPARVSAIVLWLVALAACGRISSTPLPSPRIWLVSSPMLSPAPDRSGDSLLSGELIVLDSAVFRPVQVRGGAGIATFTNFQGSRYHPEAVRAVAETPAVLDTFSRRVATVAGPGATGLLLDFQQMAPADLGGFIEMVRAIGNAARARALSPYGIIVPAGDTLAYPAPLLARVADVIVIRLGTEHRPGTRPGPLTTPEFVRRQLGNRAIGIGVSRLGAEFPLYGYLWNRDGSARIITYREANDMILREGGAFRRDPASQFLTTELRDGSTLWLPDALTIKSLISIAQSRGVNFVTLAGPAGADPAIRETMIKR